MQAGADWMPTGASGTGRDPCHRCPQKAEKATFYGRKPQGANNSTPKLNGGEMGQNRPCGSCSVSGVLSLRRMAIELKNWPISATKSENCNNSTFDGVNG